jgi:aryl-alcohol dehydrogenase-like predicted oxidoreductase
VALTDELKRYVPDNMTMAQMALRWILDHDAVSTIIPGASSPEQAKANTVAAGLPPLPEDLHTTFARFYKEQVAPHIRGVY